MNLELAPNSRIHPNGEDPYICLRGLAATTTATDDKEIIAAVAEVEWREYALRAKNLRRRISAKLGRHLSESQAKALGRAWSVFWNAVDSADKCREWGADVSRETIERA